MMLTTPYCLKRFSHRALTIEERIFTISGRRVVENAFGILASRFRVFNTPIALNVYYRGLSKNRLRHTHLATADFS